MIFADGTFIDGSTSELSCDGPLREPFAVFCQVCSFVSCNNATYDLLLYLFSSLNFIFQMQGGTHWTQWGLVLGEVLKSL